MNKVRNYLPAEHPYYNSRTQLQWRNLGREINEDAEGKKFWTNRNCQISAIYYTESETHPASDAEKEEWKAEKREISRERRARKKAEEARRKDEEEIKRKQEEAREKRERERKRKIREVDKAKIICLDVETTGLLSWEDEILQLSIIDGYGNELFNEYIKPKKLNEWDEAEKIHGISPAMVADRPNIDAYIPAVNKILSEAELIVGYNITFFDLDFLKDAGICVPEDVLVYDVMLEFAPIYGEIGKRGGYKWQKLSTCAEFYGYGSATFHDSLEDAKATLYCFLMMIREGEADENSFDGKSGRT